MASMLDIPFTMVAYSIFAAPFAILVIGAILYYYKPIHRLTVGIILVTLSGVGLAIYPVVFLLTLTKGNSSFGVLLSLTIVFAEVLTLYIGIISLMRRNVSPSL